MKFDFRNFPDGSRIEVEQQPNKTVRFTYKPPAESSATQSGLSVQKLIEEFVALCEIGDITEDTDDGIGWGAVVKDAKAWLASTSKRMAPECVQQLKALAEEIDCHFGKEGWDFPRLKRIACDLRALATSAAATQQVDGGAAEWRETEPTHQHIKSGSFYNVRARGKLQTDHPIEDMEALVAYQGEDGRWWFRPSTEFNERFKRTTATPPPAPQEASAAAGGWQTEYGWLVENGKKQGEGLAYRCMDHGSIEWTEDPHKALRFARRVDAEAFAQEDEDAWRIVEHAFDTPPSPPQGKI